MQETQVAFLVGKIPWRRECNPLQYSCLENPMDREAWQATAHAISKSQTRMNDWHFHFLSLKKKKSVRSSLNMGVHSSFIHSSSKLDRTHMSFNHWMARQIVEYYSAIKMKKVLTHITMWMNFQGIMLSERNQTQKSNTVWFHLYNILEMTKLL